MPIVGLDWIERCVLEEKYIRPKNYEVTFDETTPKGDSQKKGIILCLLVAGFKFSDSDLDSLFSNVDCADKSWAYLKDCRFFISGLSEDKHIIQRKLIAIGGGFESSRRLLFTKNYIHSSLT